jgi:hypothetical protein|tara:strand:- start:2999 stop:3409 length:411 start_codon:yes stop_codon:yes gene_type:complete
MGDNTSTDKLSTPTNLYGNLPAPGGDSATKVKQFFNQYYTEPFEFASNEVDATVAFFAKRGFDEISANSIATIVMQQAKMDDVKIFELLDTLGGFDDVQLSTVITEILNYNRSKISTLGYKVDQATNKLETRNIVV